MLIRRVTEAFAMMMIGDSVLSLVNPQRHLSLWQDGPRWWEKSVGPFVRHPGSTRLLGLAGLGLGLWLAQRQQPRLPHTGYGRLRDFMVERGVLSR